MTQIPRIDKSVVPFTALRTQALTGMYFEYSAYYSRNRSADDDLIDVQVQNLALFAVGNHLLTKRAVANAVIAPSGTTMRVTETQSNFRNKHAKYADAPFTTDQTFLTVMRAWEFATRRKPISVVEAQSTSTKGVHYLNNATHALVSEPFFFPVGKSDAEKIEDPAIARGLARQAEIAWLSLAPETNVPWSDGTPAHRIPGAARDTVDVKSGTLLSNILVAVAGADQDRLPSYTPLPDSPSDSLPEFFRLTAENRLSWE